jgi:predicted acetyltransferase
VKLVFPTAEHKQDALNYRQEHLDLGEDAIHGGAGLFHVGDYESWLEKITLWQTNVPPGKVPSTTYFALDIDGKIIGTISVRHHLNDALKKTGGHIGYGIRPSRRRKGYGTKMLALALEKCHDLGLEKVLITCDKSNVGSAKIAMKNGGVFEKEVIKESGNICSHYWISL